MHVLNFLEDYFRENTSKWLGGQLLGTLLISFMEHRVFLFVLKTYICGNIWTELLEQSNVLGLELSVPIPSPPRGLWPNFRVWGLQNPRPICISKKHEWLQSCQFHSYNYANDNLIIRGLYKNELIGFQYIQVNEFIFYIFNEKRKFLKTSQYFSVLLITPPHPHTLLLLWKHVFFFPYEIGHRQANSTPGIHIIIVHNKQASEWLVLYSE